MQQLYFHFLLFFIYSCIGWIVEVIDQRIEIGKWVNRGFLIGPYCPIYGVGGLIMLFTLSRYMDSPVILFCMAIIICSVLEYSTSLVLEKIFKVRWWDYSNKKLNINGRVCLETMIPFGLLGILVLYVVNPFLSNKINMLSYTGLKWVSITLFSLFIVDLILSLYTIIKIKSTFKNIEKDGTEEISKKVKESLFTKNWLFRRIFKAFPNIFTKREWLFAMKKSVEKQLKNINDKISKSIKRKKD